MCQRCRDEVDERIYHYTYIWVKCGCRSAFRIYCNPADRPYAFCDRCGEEFKRTSDPRIHRLAKRSIVLHERTNPDGSVTQWAPFSPDTPPPPGAKVIEVDSIRGLERIARTGQVGTADILKVNEDRLDQYAESTGEVPVDEGLSESTLFREEMTMRQELGLSTNESEVRESIADTSKPAGSV